MNYAALATTIELNVLMHLLDVGACGAYTVHYAAALHQRTMRVQRAESGELVKCAAASFPIDRKTSLPMECKSNALDTMPFESICRTRCSICWQRDAVDVRVCVRA